MRAAAWTLLVAAALVCGCQDRLFVDMGADADGREYGVPAADIRQYARRHGISEDEAKQRFRDEVGRRDADEGNRPTAKSDRSDQ